MVVMIAQCIVCLGSHAITHKALQLQVKGQRVRGPAWVEASGIDTIDYICKQD